MALKRTASVLVLLVILALPATAAAKRPNAAFNADARGASIYDGTDTRLLLDVDVEPSTLAIGRGAASLVLKPAADGSQSARGKAYFEDGPLGLRLTYTTGPADATGSSPVTGTGTLRGHGRYFLKAKGTFTVTGSQDASGNVALRLSGSFRYTPDFPSVGSGRGH